MQEKILKKFVDDMTLVSPKEFGGKKEEVKKPPFPTDKINQTEEMRPGANWMCSCGTPVYEEGGVCPNCGDED